MISDTQLVAKYTTSRSAGDFAEIVARHVPMVLRTCRRLTGNAQDAEDAAQATFLVLAQKPGAVRENLAGWLHKVARDAAFRVVRGRMRRVRREETSARMRNDTPRRGSRDELREELDTALTYLPQRLREAVVLRYLEGRDYEDAARLAGCSEPTMRWRSMQGLNRLRAILARREAVFTLGALAALLVREGTASAATTASLTAWAGTVTVASAESCRAAVLAKSLLNAMYWAKVKMYAVSAAVIVTVVGAGVPMMMPPPAPTQTVAGPAVNAVQLGINASLGGRRPFPADNPWNQDVSREPVEPLSDRLIASLGRDTALFPDFGPSTYLGAPQGISYVVIGGNEARVPVRFRYVEDSDPGPYPIPAQLPMKEHLAKSGRPLMILDRDEWKLYELDCPVLDAGGWRATAGAIFDLRSNQLRPAGHTSADAAGLPVFPGLVRCDEVYDQKAIHHALRFSGSRIRAAHVAPARHTLGKRNDPNCPPLGMRVRLKASYDVSGFSPSMQVILVALKKYGMFLAESGTDWYFSGTNDPRWNDQDLKTLQRVKGADFEVVRMGEIHFDK
jgi:RNA polymerase sigma factor (sigma-70 family)